jgi:flagellin
MERLATGKQNANAGDRSSYVAMSDTFRLDFVGTKAGIKGASVAMGYLETGMRVLDAASSLLSRLQELAVLGANDTNTTQDHEAINAEAEALGDEFNRLMTTSAYKGKDVFVDNASSEYVSMGGRNAEMTFGIGKITYTELYGSTARTIDGGPNDNASINLSHLPSDAVAAKTYGTAGASQTSGTLKAGETYVVKAVTAADDFDSQINELLDKITKNGTAVTTATKTAAGDLTVDDVIVVTSDVTISAGHTYQKISTDPLISGATYEITAMGSSAGDISVANSDAKDLAAATSLSADFTSGATFTVNSSDATVLARVAALTEGITFRRTSGTNALTEDIEAVQAKVNTARVQAGSQYAALESAVDYTTDLTAQYELGFNTVNDVNFSMETAHLAKNQILQQAATAMLAQANQGQQSLLQLIQG